MTSEEIEKLISMHAHTQIMFKGPYSGVTRFIDHFGADEKTGPYAVLDNQNRVYLNPECVTPNDFVMAMPVPI